MHENKGRICRGWRAAQQKFSARWLVLPLALCLDLTLGDPANRWHPVAWMGSLIGFLHRRAPRHGRFPQFMYGGLIAVGGASISALVGRIAMRFIHKMPVPLAILAEAFLLKMTLSLSGLNRAGRAVEVPLRQGDLDSARQQLAWHLVSRDTTNLDASQVAAATIESLAENASDSVLAPIFYYATGGLPAAAAYRYLNTADAMLGYRDAAREWVGKAPARLDDLCNWIPARVTALIMVLFAWMVNGSPRNAWRIWQRDADQTSSPNAGHPMAAMAGALSIELDKVDHYTLGAGQRRARWPDIARARRLVQLTTFWAVTLITIAAMAAALFTHTNALAKEKQP